jgi:hypothetical protein
MDLHDVRMLEPGDGLGFRQEARLLGRVGVAGGEHLEGDGALEGQVPGPVHDAHAAAAKHRLHLVTGNLRQLDGERARRERCAARRCAECRKHRLDFRVDPAEFLPLPLDFREQLGAVAAHFFRGLARVEHLLEQSEHLGVAGHRPSSSWQG